MSWIVELVAYVGLVTLLVGLIVGICHMLGILVPRDPDLSERTEEQKRIDKLVDMVASLEGAEDTDEFTKMSSLIFAWALREGKTEVEAMQLVLARQAQWRKEKEEELK